MPELPGIFIKPAEILELSDKLWLAGFFDASVSTIIVSTRDKRKNNQGEVIVYPRIRVKLSHKDVTDPTKAIALSKFGGTLYKYKVINSFTGETDEGYEWVALDIEAVRLINLVRYHLRLKTQQADYILQWGEAESRSQKQEIGSEYKLFSSNWNPDQHQVTANVLPLEYIAGFFDASGTISIENTNNKLIILLHLPSRSWYDLLKNQFNIGNLMHNPSTRDPQTTSNGIIFNPSRDVFSWEIRGDNAKSFLRQIITFLSVQKDRAEEILFHV